jgi:hypothetical protein
MTTGQTVRLCDELLRDWHEHARLFIPQVRRITATYTADQAPTFPFCALCEYHRQDCLVRGTRCSGQRGPLESRGLLKRRGLVDPKCTPPANWSQHDGRPELPPHGLVDRDHRVAHPAVAGRPAC